MQTWPDCCPVDDGAEHPEEEESSRPVEGRPCCFLWATGGIGFLSVYTCSTFRFCFSFRDMLNQGLGSWAYMLWALIQASGYIHSFHLDNILILFLVLRSLKQKRRRMPPCLLKRGLGKANWWRWSRRLCPRHRVVALFHALPAPWKLKLTGRQILRKEKAREAGKSRYVLSNSNESH